MKKPSGDSSEKKLLRSVERGEWQSVSNVTSERKRLRKAAAAALKEQQYANECSCGLTARQQIRFSAFRTYPASTARITS